MASMKKSARVPVIGIDCSSNRPDTPVLNPQSAFYYRLPMNYVRAVERAGGLPLILPLVQEPDLIAQMLERIDGLLLSGGYDVDPAYFGQEPHPNLGTIDVDRDRFESVIVPLALKKKGFPILGICRGIQSLNAFAGGTLFQDLSQIEGELVKHRQSTDRPHVTHEIEIERGSLMRKIFRKTRLRVNSYHHQAVDAPAPGFVVTARSRDGVIEAIEKPGERFVLGIQAHPEQVEQDYPEFRKLFRAFVDAARR